MWNSRTWSYEYHDHNRIKENINKERLTESYLLNIESKPGPSGEMTVLRQKLWSVVILAPGCYIL